MARLAEASKMFIMMSILNGEEHGAGEGESTAMHGWQGVLHALSNAGEALPAAAMLPDVVGPADRWKVLHLLVVLVVLASVAGILYFMLSWCRCYKLRSSATGKGTGDV